MHKRNIFIVLLIMIFPLFVRASEVTCEYKLDTGRNFKVCVYYKYGLPVTYDSCGTNVKFDSSLAIDLVNNDFIGSSENITCPTIRAGFKADRNQYTVTAFTKDLNADIISSYHPKNIDGQINEEKSKFDDKESGSKTSDNYACIYYENTESEISLSWNGKEVVAILPSDGKYKNYCGYNLSDSLTADDFKDKSCPDIFAIAQARQTVADHMISSGSCKGVLSINKNTGVTGSSSSSPRTADSVQNVDTGEKERYTKVTKKKDDVPANCDALLTEEVQTLLRNILNIVKYAGPILVIVLTIFDLIKASLSGDEGEIKKVSNKFVKRLIAAILLFFIPILIGFLFDFFDITSYSCLNI